MTETAIHFAFLGEELEIDHIPLAEIMQIAEMKGSNICQGIEEVDDLNSENKTAIHIATEQAGNNSGRDYYLQSCSKELEGILVILRTLSREAKKHCDNHSIFQRAQKKVKRLYEATPTQAFICLLFAMVRERKAHALSFICEFFFAF